MDAAACRREHENLQIIRRVAASYRVPSRLLVNGSRQREVVEARRLAVANIMQLNPETTRAELCDLFAVDRATARRYLVQAGLHQVTPYVPRRRPNEPDPMDVIAEVEERTKHSLRHMRSPSRYGPLVTARHEAVRAVRERCPSLSIAAIGRLFRRDHTTICHALGTLARSVNRERATGRTAPKSSA